jgi:signal transduction histidine kinase/CheY-like chemotaxis protein
LIESTSNTESNEGLIEKERFALYMREMLRACIGSIVIGLPLFAFIFGSQAHKHSFIIWFTFDVVLLVSVLFTFYGFYKYNDKFTDPMWKRISDIPILIFSLYIASAPWLWLQNEVDIYFYTMFIMVIALTGTITQSISYYFSRQVVFSTLPILSLLIKFYTMESQNHVEIYIVVLLVLGGLIAFSHHINKSLIHSIVLKIEHLQARENAERVNAEKSQFIAAASHDIRQPLQAINLLVDTLKLRNKNTEDEVLFNRLESSVDSMSELLNSLLDVSKLDAQVIVPQPQHICLMALLMKLQGELEPLAKAKGLDLTVEAENIAALADVILLEQVLNNLLSNAIRYTEHGGIILSAQKELGKITISVRDTGIGIDSLDQEAIFLEFHQLHNQERDQSKGLGLGLSIVKRLCTLQHWPLSLDSELAVGSCFSFTIPQGSSALIPVIEKTDINKNLVSVDVVLVDDHEGIRFSLSNMLRSWGCKVRTFDCADRACEELRSFPEWQPNLIISDYRLRNNLTGIEGIAQIKRELKGEVESIIISGDTAPDIIKKIEGSGLIVLHKPIKPAKLRVVLSRKMKSIIENN